MANEFDYTAELSILHPSIDPKVITMAITELHPQIEAFAGSERRDSRGNLLTPPRKTMYSHWLAPLHSEERLFSGDTEISQFILNRLAELERHRDLLHELNREGQVTLKIALYTRSNYSADVLKADALKQFGELGIDLELNIYDWSRKVMAANEVAMNKSLALLQQATKEAGPLMRVQHVTWNELPNEIVSFTLVFQNMELTVAVQDNDSVELMQGSAEIEPDHSLRGNEDCLWSEAIGKPIRWGWLMTNQQGYQDAVQFEFARNVSEQSTIIQLVAVSSSLKVLSVRTKQEVADEKLIAMS